MNLMTNNSISLEKVLNPNLVFCKEPRGSKKKALEQIAHYAAEVQPQLDEINIFNSLISRERLGSTGIGQGIAIPHCRVEQCNEVLGILMTLVEPIPFDAIDNEPVDVLFTLIVPQEATSEHLDLLSQLAEKFNNPQFCESLRACNSHSELHQKMIG
jgi:PTS system nitrogen regulatory IIA component